jgi:hypothetical protein
VNTRRLAVASVAVLAAVGFAAGCKGTTGDGTQAGASTSASGAAPASASPSTASSSAAKDALLAAAEKLGQTSYHYTLSSSGLTGSGASDPTTMSMRMSMSGAQGGMSLKLDLVKIGADMYLKLDAGQLTSQLGVSPDKWMHVDGGSLGANSNLLELPGGGDPGAVNGLLAGVVTAQSTDGRNFTGTLDLTKATGSSTPSSDALSRAGDKAKAVPFTAALDDQGRMTSLKIDGSGIEDGLTVSMTFSDYGAPADIAKPAASSVVEAPDAISQLLKK